MGRDDARFEQMLAALEALKKAVQNQPRPTDLIYPPTREMLDAHKKECLAELDKKLTALKTEVAALAAALTAAIEAKAKQAENGATKTTHQVLQPVGEVLVELKKLTYGTVDEKHARVFGLIDRVEAL